MQCTFFLWSACINLLLNKILFHELQFVAITTDSILVGEIARIVMLLGFTIISPWVTHSSFSPTYSILLVIARSHLSFSHIPTPDCLSLQDHTQVSPTYTILLVIATTGGDLKPRECLMRADIIVLRARPRSCQEKLVS